jgi:hypothetical protein
MIAELQRLDRQLQWSVSTGLARSYPSLNPAIKMAPYGAKFQEAELVGDSGKAMQDAVPPARTAKEVTLFVEESEGHTSFAAS